jgi:orotate phosphoribosyltransferase
VTTDSTALSPTPREQLRDLITELAVVHGRVTLSSGAQADY